MKIKGHYGAPTMNLREWFWHERDNFLQCNAMKPYDQPVPMPDDYVPGEDMPSYSCEPDEYNYGEEEWNKPSLWSRLAHKVFILWMLDEIFVQRLGGAYVRWNSV
tara:strand:- start:10 stop:324 length:315 start_codon:yes stop_codon:yes gene_type:complete